MVWPGTQRSMGLVHRLNWICMPHDMPCEKKILAALSQKDCWRRSFCTPFFIASNNTEGKEVSALNAFWEDKINDAPREKGE